MNQVAQEPEKAELCFRAEKLTKVYGSGHSAVHALRGIDLELPERELVELLESHRPGD